MKTIFRQVCVALVLAALTTAASRVMQSDYLGKFLDENLVILLLALTAINGSTVGLVVGKMSDIMSREAGMTFDNARRSLKLANVEQLVLVVVALCLEILKHSKVANGLISHQGLIVETLLMACLIQSIQIVFDMLHSVFILVDRDAT